MSVSQLKISILLKKGEDNRKSNISRGGWFDSFVDFSYSSKHIYKFVRLFNVKSLRLRLDVNVTFTSSGQGKV